MKVALILVTALLAGCSQEPSSVDTAAPRAEATHAPAAE